MHSQFPSNETLAAFIDGRLDSRMRSRVAQHLTACDDCYAMVADARAAREAIGEAAFEPRGFATPETESGKLLPFPLLAAAAAVAAGLAAVYFVPSVRDLVPGLGTPSVAAVVESSDKVRVTQTRVAEMTVYREPVRVMRGGGDGESGDPGETDERLELRSKENELLTASADHPSRRNLHALGVALLLDKKPEEAIKALERAAQLGPPDADLLNDLAAAYTDRRVKRGAPRPPAPDDAPQVLAAVERAWQAAKTPASAWNRALALQAVGRDAEAKAAWQQYMQLETDPQWLGEAKEHLDVLNEFGAPP
jgi:tetratricopeptide (TPR) repeat protein